MAPMLFADAIMNDRAIKVFNHGKMSRDFTYIDDIVSGILTVIDHPAKASSHFDAHHPNPSLSCAPYRLYNIGNNAPVNLMEFIETLEKAIGKEAKKDFMDIQAGDVESTYADTSGLIEDFGYAPYTPLQKGIGEFVAWYEAYCKKI